MQTVHHYVRYIMILCRWAILKVFPGRQAKTDSLTSLLSSQIFHHACKTPLSVLLCNLEIALEDQQNNKTNNTKLVKQSFQAAQKLRLLLSHVDDPDNQAKEVFDIATVLEQLAAFVNARYNSAIIVVKVPNALITGNKLYLQEALQCLIINAVEAQLSINHQVPVVIIYGLVVKKQLLRIDIIDFGAGMNRAETRLALMQGVTYKQSGTGLGLPFARQIIEKHFSGLLRITSTVKVGTRVVVRVPL